jgi:hypothetical protein
MTTTSLAERPAQPRASVAPRRTGLDLVARTGICVGLIGATIIHGTVVAHHFQQWPPAGVFFLVLQVVEVVLALGAVYVWGPRTAQAVVLTGFGTVLVWLLSRTLGMPIGPETFQLPEPVGVPDLACCFLELGAAALAAPMALARRAPTARRVRNEPAPRVGGTVVALAVVVGAIAVVATAWGLGPAAHGNGHGAHTRVTVSR